MQRRQWRAWRSRSQRPRSWWSAPGCGAGLRRYELPNITYTDVALHPDLACVCDAHDLPFADASFDGVVASAVLEHVMDPIRCVAEIVRVLRSGGMVYAVTPFMQSVHMGRHDFTGWSHLGHPRLFRYFDDMESGICGGPGSAAALSLRALLMSMSDRPSLRRYLRLAGLLLAYPVMQVGRLALRTHAAYDGACAVVLLRQEARHAGIRPRNPADVPGRMIPVPWRHGRLRQWPCCRDRSDRRTGSVSPCEIRRSASDIRRTIEHGRPRAPNMSSPSRNRRGSAWHRCEPLRPWRSGRRGSQLLTERADP